MYGVDCHYNFGYWTEILLKVKGSLYAKQMVISEMVHDRDTWLL